MRARDGTTRWRLGWHVDVLAISTAPVVLGGGKRLFDGFERDLDLEKVSVHSSQYATHVIYTVKV